MHSFLVSVPPTIKPGPDVLEIVPETSIGIDDIRRIQTFLSRKPLQSRANIVIVRQAEKLTLPAQHAFLKTLEEPPGNSQIYLVTAFPDQLLPTVLSRVQMTNAQTFSAPDPEKLQKTQEILNLLLSAKGAGERLKIFDDAAFTRESALEFLDHLEFLLHQKLDLGLSYHLLVDTRKYLTANVNVKLALDHFALNI